MTNESESLGSERDQAVSRLKKRRDFYFRSPITEAEVQREIERMR